MESSLHMIKEEFLFAISLLRERKYANLTANILIVSLLLFISLTLFFDISRLVFFNYYLRDGIAIAIFGFSIIIVGAILNGVLISYLFYKFRFKDTRIFFLIYSVLFIVFYYFLLSESVFSYFSFIEMNSPLYVLLNSFTLYFTLSLSAFLLSHIKDLFKGGLSRSGGGIIAALFSLGCPSCGALLWSLAGVAGFATFLPFGGLELRVASLLLLIWALYEMYKTMNFKGKVNVEFKLK